MAKEVFIPKLGQTVEEVTLVRWLVADGAKVEQGDGILEVETDKALFTVESSARGYLHIGPYKEGEIVPVLTVVATIGKPEEKFAPALSIPPSPLPLPSLGEEGGTEGGRRGLDGSPSSQPSEEKGRVFVSPRARKLAAAKGVDLTQVTPTGGNGQRVAERDVLAYLANFPQAPGLREVKATPVAQKVAAEAGIDLRAVTGTGPGGKITKEDVERAKAPAVTPPAVVLPAVLPEVEVLERVPLKGVRGIIAERMATSVHTTARVTLLMEADATEFVTMRERLKVRVAEEWGFAPGYNDLLAKIVTIALRQFPYMNARLAPSTGSGQAPDAIERLAHINLGMATDAERGLLVPVIRDADKKSLRQFGVEFRELVDRARNGRSLPDDLTGGTFTITNLGMYDVLAFTPIINLPQAAILGVGCITPKPVARNGQVEVRQMLILSLAFDHRLVDGAPAARFLQYIKDLIEEPYLWLAQS
jgi:pyruvate dehydrogenase E2 component (dihydrolipoamide acetyltransferase)